VIGLVVVVFAAIVLAGQAVRWAAHVVAVRVARRYITPDAATRREQPGIAWLVHKPHTQHARQATEQHQPCHRCRTGSTAFRCTCTDDCYAAACTAAYTPRGDT
jgi:hypothetical protein